MESEKSKGATSLSLKTILIYSVANIGCLALDSTFDQFNIFYYVHHKLTTPLLIGIAVLFGRIVDALANPIVGYWSDRKYGVRGRRLPFVVSGVLPMTIFFILFFRPIFKDAVSNFIFAAATCGGMLFFYTYVVAPYLALLPDLARTTDDRVKMSSWVSIFGIVGIIVGFVVAGILVDTLHSFFLMAVIIGGISLATFMITALGIKERPVAREDRVQLSFWESVLPALKSKMFLIYIFSISSFWVGFKVLQTSINFVFTTMFGKPEGYGGTFGMGGMILVWLLATPFIFLIVRKIGKKRTYYMALLAIAVISSLQGLIPYITFMNPLIYYHIVICFFGIPFAALLVIYNAILGDIIDHDAKTTGYRREAMYYGMEGLFTKTARGIGSVSVAFLFAVFGDPSVSHAGILAAGPFCGLFAFLGFLLFLRYPLNE
ncbi:MAG: MFS transporter [bacterium]